MALSRPNENTFDYEHVDTLVMEGCGARFIPYIQVVKVLEAEQKLAQIQRVAASSSGSVVAFLFALGYTPNEMEQMFDKVNFADLLDPSLKSQVPVIGPLIAGIANHGMCAGSKMIKFIEECIAAKGFAPTVTFAELQASGRGKELYLTATNLSRGGELQIFSSATTPHVPLVSGVMAALAYPGLLRPVSILMDYQVEEFYDGGVRTNFPVNIFPMEEWSRVLALRVDTREEVFGFNHRSVGISNLLIDLVHDGYGEDQRLHRKRTLQMYDAGFGSLQVNLSPLQRLALKFSGEIAAQEFVARQKLSAGSCLPLRPTYPIDASLKVKTAEYLTRIKRKEDCAILYRDLVSENSDVYIHTHVLIAALREQAGGRENSAEYKQLLAYLKDHAIQHSLKPHTSPEVITAVILEFLKSNEIIEVLAYWEKIRAVEGHARLKYIDYDVILKALPEDSQTHPEQLQQFKALVETMRGEQFKTHPGACEANVVASIDQSLKAHNYDEASWLLRVVFLDLSAEQQFQLYHVLQDQLQAHATQASLRLLADVQRKTGKYDPVIIRDASGRTQNVISLGAGCVATALALAVEATTLPALLAGLATLGVVKLGGYAVQRLPKKAICLFSPSEQKSESAPSEPRAPASGLRRSASSTTS